MLLKARSLKSELNEIINIYINLLNVMDITFVFNYENNKILYFKLVYEL